MVSHRSIVLAASMLVAGGAFLVSDVAEACDWQPGIAGVYPHSEQTLAANDAIVFSVIDADVGEYTLNVEVDGTPVEAEIQPLFTEQTVFLDAAFHRLVLSDALTEGSMVTVTAESELFVGVEASYAVGPADASELAVDPGGVELAVEFVPDDNDSCSLPAHYNATATLGAALMQGEGERSRFLQLSFHATGGDPIDTVGRAIRPLSDLTGDASIAVYGGFPGGEDPAALCARVSLLDALGGEELLFEDCALCDSSPAACDSGGTTGGGETDGGSGEGGSLDDSGGAETDGDSAGAASEGSGGGCSTAGHLPLYWSLLMLGLVAIRKTRR